MQSALDRPGIKPLVLLGVETLEREPEPLPVLLFSAFDLLVTVELEELGILISVIEELLLHVAVPISLRQVLLPVGQVSISEEWPDVEGELADQVIAGDDVFVPCLNCQLVLGLEGLQLEDGAPVEAGLAVAVAPMGVRQLVLARVVEVGADENITAAFNIHMWDFLRFPNDKTCLVKVLRLTCDECRFC